MSNEDPRTPELASVLLALEKESAIATIKLNRPERLNAIAGQVISDLMEALAWVESVDARCLVVRGEGRGFSAGADLESYLAEVDVSRPDEVDAFLERWNALFRRVRSLRVPSIAAVHGAAYGGGLNLALACDFVIAARSARLCEPYVRLGATADVGSTWILPQLVGLARARRLILTGEVVGADDALAMGLIAYVAADDDFDREVDELARRIASLDQASMRANRGLLAADHPLGLEEAFGREMASLRERVMSPEFAQATAQFRHG